MKKIVLKVNINCNKCKTCVMRAVTKLTGIDQVTVDGEKGTLTVVGDVDPVLVVKQIRKIGKVADIISVGPPKPASPKSKPNPCLPLSCKECDLVALSFSSYDSARFCAIL